MFVESLDAYFKSVCELDLIFHMHKGHQILSELVTGGLVVDTSKANVLKAVREQDIAIRSEAGK